MLTCFQVAEYFLSLVDEDAGELISNLKLQKLVYYAQGFHLALYDRPLFEEEIQAWKHGPVVPVLYHKYKQYGADAIPKPVNMDFSVFDDEVRKFLDEVYQVYGQYSAWKLRDMTHEEPPWVDAYDSLDLVIHHNALKSYFSTLVTADN